MFQRALLYILSLVIFMGAGCSTGPLSMKPIDAKIPELRFWYFQATSQNDDGSWAGKWIPARHIANAEILIGSPKKFRIKTHKKAGDCFLVYSDGDNHFTRDDCENKSIYELNLGYYYENHPSVISMSVSHKDTGTQFADFYPIFKHRKSQPLSLSFRCPYQETKQNRYSVCVRPATYNYKMTIDLTSVSVPGTLLYEYNCQDGQAHSVTPRIEENQQKVVSILVEDPKYCAITFGYKADSGETFFHILDAQFYDPLYIPLPTPTINKEDDGYEACASEDYEVYSVNNIDRGSWYQSKCYKTKSDNVEILVWDEIGRHSWSHVGELRLLTNNVGFELYSQLRPFFERHMQDQCSRRDKKCAKRVHAKLLRHPFVIKAMESWSIN